MKARIMRVTLRWFCIALLVAGIPCVCYGQNITLNENQRAYFVRLIKSDREAGSLFDRVRKQADQALDAQPNPVRLISSGGRLQDDPVKLATRESLKDMNKVFSLAVAFAGTGESSYAAKAKALILKWADLNEPSGQPIDETNLDLLFLGYDLTRKTFSADERGRADSWLRRVAEAEISHRDERSGNAINNWNSHRLKIIGMIAFLLGDRRLIDYSVNGYKRQIADNLRRDGSSFDFEERDSVRYHCYDLEPLLALARVSAMNGLDLYHYIAPNGTSLPAAVAFALPFIDGTRTHAEFVHSKVAFDVKRAEAGESHYQSGRPFEPPEGRKMLELDYFFDKGVLPLVTRLYGGKAAKYPSVNVLLMEAEKTGM
jgi:hypothetical protein